MNGVIAAQIAVRAMQEQFAEGDGRTPDNRSAQSARWAAFARTLRSLIARGRTGSRRTVSAARGAR